MHVSQAIRSAGTLSDAFAGELVDPERKGAAFIVGAKQRSLEKDVGGKQSGRAFPCRRKTTPSGFGGHEE